MENEKYIRVGTSLFKLVQRPGITGELSEVRQPWSYETLRQDHSKDFISKIPKYDGFCIVPNHTQYQSVIKNFLNMYESVGHLPQPGKCPVTLAFIRHIFGKQYELGLDYIQLLYIRPTIKLPILLLVSNERNTGKTTFLNFLKAIFKGNMTFNTNEDFRSQFNADWTNKLIVAVDEVLLNRREDSERLKNLSTALSHKTEAKGKDRNEIQFFGKFILCSNNEVNPIIIDPGEIRYWVRKVIPFERENTNMLNTLKQEIPYFLYFLQHRELSTRSESRMWFRSDLIQTDALKRIIAYNRNRLEVEIRELLQDIMESCRINEIRFCLNDIVLLLSRLAIKAEKHQIRKIILYDWKLEAAPNSFTYQTYEYNYNAECCYSPVKHIGRYYTITKEQLLII